MVFACVQCSSKVTERDVFCRRCGVTIKEVKKTSFSTTETNKVEVTNYTIVFFFIIMIILLFYNKILFFLICFIVLILFICNLYTKGMEQEEMLSNV